MGNKATEGGGGSIMSLDCTLIITQCVFDRNYAQDTGAAILANKNLIVQER